MDRHAPDQPTSTPAADPGSTTALANSYAAGLSEPECDADLVKLYENAPDGRGTVPLAMGMCRHYGWGFPRDFTLAADFYRKAADSGLLEALVRLDELRNATAGASGPTSGKTTAKIAIQAVQKAFEAFVQKAGDGDPRAQFNAGYCRYWGIGVAEDRKAARELFVKSADQGCADAIYMLALLSEDEQGPGYKNRRGVGLLMHAAECGSAEAQYELGRAYYRGSTSYGLQVKENPKQAVIWFQKAVQQNHACAANLLARCYYNGQGVEEDTDKAFALWKTAALLGDVRAQLRVSDCFRNVWSDNIPHVKWPVDKDMYQAAYWCLKACSQDNKHAKENISDILRAIDEQLSVVTEPKKQFNLYAIAKKLYSIITQQEQQSEAEEVRQKVFAIHSLAARLGFESSYAALAACYESGQGVQQDIHSALRWSVRAMHRVTEEISRLSRLISNMQTPKLVTAFQSHPYLLSTGAEQIYQLGKQAEITEKKQSMEKALQYYTISAKMGHADAAARLAGLFSTDQLPSDPVAAFQVCKCAATGSELARRLMIFNWKYSTDLENDFADFVEYFTEKADTGDADAAYQLANCYYFGLGIQKDYRLAVDYYTYSAENGNSEAQYMLGCCIMSGTGAMVNPHRALSYFLKAAEQAHLKAVKEVISCYENGTGTDTNLVEALKYRKMMAETGDLSEQLYVAECYKSGNVVQKSDSDALHWYEIAATNGKPECYSFIASCYENGIGTNVDLDKAYELYLKLQPGDEIQAAFLRIADRYENHESSLDLGKAFKIYQQLATRYPSDQNWLKLAECYETGRGTDVNLDKAYETCLKADPSSEMRAVLMRIARFYEQGSSLSGNAGKAYIVYQKLLDLYPSKANLLKVAKLLEAGIGVPKNIQKAVKHYERAEAFATLGDMYYEGKAVAKSLSKAVAYYERADDLTAEQLTRQISLIPFAPKTRSDPLARFAVLQKASFAIRAELRNAAAAVQ